ncbi:MAG: hypothetical protein COA88_09560 [Kordia sp.]|nr:MAG: hypothetical protein COA88_09560 [Kordia sp.]
MRFIINVILIGAILISPSCSTSTFPKTIVGNLSLLANQKIKLEGFNGLKSYSITSTTTDAKGNFKLNYSKLDYGMGYLISENNKSLFVVLNGEDVHIIGETLSKIEAIKVKKGQENQWFEQYAKEHPRREQILKAWDYLEKVYTADSLFSVQNVPIKSIQQEKQRIKNEDAAFLEKLPKDSYVSWFLPIRKLASSVATIAQYRKEEIPATIVALRAIDYTDLRLYKSGLLKTVIESHFWLLENSGHPLDSVLLEMKISIDGMMVNLIKDEKKFNEVNKFLFELLERHSLFQASEYLAIKVLNEDSCTIDDDLAKQLESYRAMRKGKTAPDIVFNGDRFALGYNQSTFPKKLSSIKSKYTVVVFGASWCPKCSEDLLEISSQYTKWKEQGIEVVFISLDEDKEKYNNFVKILPFISVCDYQKWNSDIVKNYYVFGTPTIYLLNESRTILLRPNSVKQLDTWVDWNLLRKS